MGMNYVKKACAIAGSQALLARLLGVTPAVVYQWVSGLRPVPVRYCAAIERATAGAVTRQDLRPDDWVDIWPELANTHAVSTQAAIKNDEVSHG